MWIERSISQRLKDLSQKRPALLLTGSRQTGKTSLLRHCFPDSNYVSLDLPLSAELAEQDGQQFLAKYSEPLIIDEVQYAPRLFRYLKLAIDQKRDGTGRFYLTGSQKFSLMQNISESLAGRISIIECLPLSLTELENHFRTKAEGERLIEWILKGGYPEIYRASLNPTIFYSDYVATYLERDVRQLINVKDLRDFERFMRLLAAQSGQLLSFTSLASDVGVSPNTIKSWISVLETSQIVHLIEPYYRNASKSIKKNPKVYFHDTGLCCFLQGISEHDEILNHQNLGAIFETLVFGQIYRKIALDGHIEKLYFYRDAQGREVDFIIEKAGKFRLVEVKWSRSPKLKSQGFEAFAAIVGDDKITERRFVTKDRTRLSYPEGYIGNPVDW
jgi:predicted AAA+ superfamily ATPase